MNKKKKSMYGDKIKRMVTEYKQSSNIPLPMEGDYVTFKDAYLAKLKMEKWVIEQAIKEIEELRNKGLYGEDGDMKEEDFYEVLEGGFK